MLFSRASKIPLSLHFAMDTDLKTLESTGYKPFLESSDLKHHHERNFGMLETASKQGHDSSMKLPDYTGTNDATTNSGGNN